MNLRKLKKHKKPIFCTTMVWGVRRQGKVLGKLKQSHLEPYPAPEKAAKVLAHLVRYSEYLGVARRK